jgi:hypothetical protein
MKIAVVGATGATGRREEKVSDTFSSSSEPLANPWYLHIDGSLARSLGFQPIVRTVYQAVQEKLM